MSAYPCYAAPNSGLPPFTVPPMRNDARGSGHGQAPNQAPWPRTGIDTSVPIAKVLNTDPPPPPNPVSTCSTKPFSGRLSDLLLDTAEQATGKERIEQLALPLESRPPEASHSVIQLPKLPQLAAKKTPRPRIPPLLQGLHQPPPLPPSDQLYPPITSDQGVFASGSRDRASFICPVRASTAVTANTGIATHENSRPESSSLTPNERGPQTRDNDSSKDVASSQDQVPQSHDESNGKSTKKRRRWTPEETKDLITGISKYGIGSWKKILQSPEFNFHGRNAVDLKDRFRVCCPGEFPQKTRPRSKGREQLKAKRKDSSNKPLPSKAPAIANDSQGSSGNVAPPQMAKTRKPKVPNPSTILSQMADLGIQGPFQRRSRRPRCRFSAQDDENLLKGFEKHGSSWCAIRKDKSLGFDNRRSTDLRDRFRIRFPEKFVQAGYKPKRKQDNNLGRLPSKQASQPHLDMAASSTPPQPNTGGNPNGAEAERSARPSDHVVDTTFVSSNNATPRLDNATTYTFNPFPAMFDDDYGNLEQDDLSDGPIILNRDILEWADANRSSAQIQGTSEPSSRPSNATDGNTFSAWAGSQGPSTDVSFHSIPPASSRAGLAFNGHHNRSTSTNATANARSNSNTSAGNRVATSTVTNRNMREATDLPTIVFPHVPASSARNLLHRLPTPADLLSGVDEFLT